MEHKNKTKNDNQPKIDLESVEVQTISTSNNYMGDEPIKMFSITFKVGSKKHCQTRHMTDSQMDEYRKNPSIDKVTNASKGKGLQDSLYQV